LELQVEFAAISDEMTANEIASGGFARHGENRACARAGRRAKWARIIAVAMSHTDSNTPLPGFQYSRHQFEELVDLALSHAKTLGAADAAAEVSEGAGLSVSVRKAELENVERNRDKSLGVTVYLGQRRGNASTSDFSA